LLEIRIRGFRSIRDATLVLKQGVNFLIGPNGSGKTNVLAALKFLRDVVTSGAALAMGRAGGAPRNYFRGRRDITISVSGNYDTCRFRRASAPFSYVWEITIAQSGPERISSIARERLRLVAAPTSSHRVTALDIRVSRTRSTQIARSWILPENQLGSNLFKHPRGGRQSGSKTDIFSFARKKLSQIARGAKVRRNHSFIVPLATLHPSLGHLVRQVTQLDEYNIRPEAARKSTDQVPVARMEPDGTGLGEVVHALLNREWHRIMRPRRYLSPFEIPHYPAYFHLGRYSYPYYSLEEEEFLMTRGKSGHTIEASLSNIMNHLSSAVKSIDRLSTQIDPTNGRRFVVFHSSRNKFLPEEVSDGTIKWLSLLVSIYAPHSRTYLLEEPENFMHPWMQQRLVEITREQARADEIMFIVTTHSATVLNSAQPDELILVDYLRGSTVTSRITQRDEVAAFLKDSHFGLGDLWVSGGIGAVPAGENR